MKNLNPKPVSDYILIRPDKPTAGKFDVGATYINETATVDSVGPLVSEEIKKLVGKRIIFNSWACDEKTIEGKKVYLVPESANAICCTI